MKERALVTFIEDKEFLLAEVRNLYKSCRAAGITHNSDLVICAPKNIWHKLPTDDFVVMLASDSISDGNCSGAPCYDNVFKDYHFINSIHCLVEHADFLKQYKFILRTDCDVFITPMFGDFFPSVFHTGIGAYNNEPEVAEKLQAIARRHGLRTKQQHNIGSTWYGASSDVLECAALTMRMMHVLATEEFKDYEGKWPGWFKGVMLLYASDLAINHLFDEVVVSPKFDAHSDHKTPWRESEVMHIHCWHTDAAYSKFQFLAGKYAGMSTHELDDRLIADYCMKVALSEGGDLKSQDDMIILLVVVSALILSLVLCSL